jgi:hypothetical protein
MQGFAHQLDRAQIADSSQNVGAVSTLFATRLYITFFTQLGHNALERTAFTLMFQQAFAKVAQVWTLSIG